MPGRTYSFSKPAAANSDASDDLLPVVGVGLGRAKRPVRKDVVFVESVRVRRVLLALVLVLERVMVGVRRVRIVTLY